MTNPEIHTTESASALTVTISLTGAATHEDLMAALQTAESRIYEFNAKQYRAQPPRLLLYLSNMYTRRHCAITGKEFEGGEIEYVLDELHMPAVHPDFVKETDPVLYQMGEILRDFYGRLMWAEVYRKGSADYQRLDRVLARILSEEIYRKVKPEALKQRLELLFKNVPPVTYAPDNGDDIPFGPPSSGYVPF